ncbi:MAG: tRNA pseudouridine(55) synthase TruB [Erysipelotrichaceae bacterium]|nr:tRNA pseudouridine(55) synthase TruB [Erysipelotrichaceae bacterium]
MGKIILVDKPKGITSFDLCFKMRRVFNTKKIGHTGTLDPNATGLMMILVDNASKANQFLVTATKEYIATVKLGIKTDSDDIDGKILEEREETVPNKEELVNTFKKFIGKSKQVPSMFSAIKVNGKKLYEYQREGKTVEIEPRDIEVFYIELLDITDDGFIFKTKVSSGTYIRTLAQDILNDLGLIGTLSELRRTMIDDFSVEDASTLEEVLEGKYTNLNEAEVLSKYYDRVEIRDRKHVTDGKSLRLEGYGDTVLCVNNDEALAIYVREEDGRYYCKRGLL